MSNMWVVALTEELYYPWDLLIVAEHDKTKGSNSGSSNVVTNVRHGNVKKLADRLIVGRSSVSQGYGEHPAVSQDGVLLKDVAARTPLSPPASFPNSPSQPTTDR